MTDTTKSDTAALLEYVAATTAPNDHDHDQIFGVHVPAHATYKLIDMEGHADKPRRPRGASTLRAVPSFISFIERYESDDMTLWADPTSAQVTAVLNDHQHAGPDVAGWGDWRATLLLTKTPAYAAWRELHRKPITQMQFAEFVEDNLATIAAPPGADLLEIAQTFQANRRVEFRSAQRLVDGTVQLRYHEEIDASAGRDGDLAVPAELTIRTAMFEGEEAQTISVRLRYRIGDGDLRIMLVIAELEDIERKAFDAAVEAISAKWPVWTGQPAHPVRSSTTS